MYQSSMGNMKVDEAICSPWKGAAESCRSLWRRCSLSWACGRSKGVTGWNHGTNSGQWALHEVKVFPAKKVKSPWLFPPLAMSVEVVC